MHYPQKKSRTYMARVFALYNVTDEEKRQLTANNGTTQKIIRPMSFASKFNRAAFGIDTTDYTYVKLGDIYKSKDEGGMDVVHALNGIRISRSELGEAPLFIDEKAKRLVNMPQHMTDICKEILADVDAVEDIKNGKVGYMIYPYQSHGKECYGVKFVDL